MITEWFYGSSGVRERVKNFIKDNNLKCVDVGAGINYWSYPECKFVVDSLPIENFMNTPTYFDGIPQVFNLDLQRNETWDKLIEYVNIHGKFDFSICSHTLEDIVNPFEIIKLLPKISKKGFIAVPSKFDEFLFQYGRNYRGYPHHKYIFDVQDNILNIFPKFGFIEVREESKEIYDIQGTNKELFIFWENEIDFWIFSDKIFMSEDEIIGDFFKHMKYNISK